MRPSHTPTSSSATVPTDIPASIPAAPLDPHDLAARGRPGQGGPPDDRPPAVAFHIFVNRRKFTEADGIQRTMTGAQIAALVEVPADSAVIRRGNGANAEEVSPAHTLELRQAEHFLVTRKVVEGGHVR